jgi:hypothetical protein
MHFADLLPLSRRAIGLLNTWQYPGIGLHETRAGPAGTCALD